MTSTPSLQQGIWTLTAPDGRTWQADSPLKAVSAEQRERVPAKVAVERIFAACEEAQPAVLAVPVDDQNLMDEQHLRYCDRNIEASQAKGDADGVSFWHQWKAEYQRRIAAAPAIHEGGEG